MIIQKNISLKQFNTFHVEAFAKYFCEVNDLSELKSLITTDQFENEQKLILGGGSNILFTKDFDGIVIRNCIGGIEIISESEDDVLLEIGAGHDWDELVEYTVNNGFYGLENLSLIPGTVGASPIQNIGAYGVEVKDFIESVNIILLENIEGKTLSNAECDFDYRNSIFKNEFKNKFVITSVVFRLSKQSIINLTYAPLKNSFVGKSETEVTSKNIRDAVTSIRESKLPDPNKIGNAGSFFKNPIITNEKYEKLKGEYSDLNGYPESNTKIKISAGWLIERCGLKGKRIGDVGVHEKQALVIVNYGKATGVEIFEFSKMIQKEVENKFNIKIINEVNII